MGDSGYNGSSENAQGKFFYDDAVLKQRTDARAQLNLHLALTREHVFTQDKLLANAKRIKGIV